jgi:hypothetical protein
VPSRYLLIEFDDEESALRLKEKLDDGSRQGRAYRVVGLFAKPTGYCQCGFDTWTTTKASPSTTKRGRKFGWWVCTTCKRPTSALAGLINLLKPRDIINPHSWDGPDMNGHPTQWTHYIPSLSGLAQGEQGRTFWNEH